MYLFGAGEQHVLSSSFAATPIIPLVNVSVAAVVVKIEGTTS